MKGKGINERTANGSQTCGRFMPELSPLKKSIFIPGGAVGFCVLKCMLSKVCN